MSTALDPVVVRKLQHFARRRRRLIVARGLFSGIATFVACMAIVAAIDWYWLLSDSTRWSLSAGAYSIVALVVWWTSVRRLFKSPDREEIAARVELAEPELREQLLSAVELATDDPSAINDSPVFRSLLQGEVAQQMVEVRVGRLLPLKLIGRWALAALVFAGIAAALWMSDDPRFQQLARRAMMPGANIARVSRIQIEVLEPTPSSLTMAEDETVAVLVGISGGDVSEVTLETRTPENGTVRQSMRPKEASEYLANIHVSNEDVEYRVFAGDAITKRYTIQSRPRPRVVEFQKTFEYPEYSRLQKETVADTNGDLRILEGTTVQLACRLDQQVSQAELRIDPIDSDEIQTIPLKRIGKGSDAVWGADVPVTQDAVYRVHLVSKETGFDNPFSPKYEISPLPDLVPRAGFVDQQESSLLLPPNDILALKGVEELTDYVVNEILDVYRLQGVEISDKHIEVILRQMLRKVEITDPGDSDFILGEQAELSAVAEKNKTLSEDGKALIEFDRILLGITKASLATDSFVSAASFQETTRVLTEAAVTGKIDKLRGLKENVIIGKLIPAGTGFYAEKDEIESNLEMELAEAMEGTEISEE